MVFRDRRPHTGPRQRTRERGHVLPHPSYHIRARRRGERGGTATYLTVCLMGFP